MDKTGQTLKEKLNQLASRLDGIAWQVTELERIVDEIERIRGALRSTDPVIIYKRIGEGRMGLVATVFPFGRIEIVRRVEIVRRYRSFTPPGYQIIFRDSGDDPRYTDSLLEAKAIVSKLKKTADNETRRIG